MKCKMNRKNSFLPEQFILSICVQEEKLLIQSCGLSSFYWSFETAKQGLVNKAQLSRGEVPCLTSLVLAGLVVCGIVLHPEFFRHESHAG